MFASTSSSNLKSTPKPVSMMLLILPDIVMTPVDQPVLFKNSWKTDKKKARVTDDKQVKDQSTMANPDAQTSAHKPQKRMKLSVPGACHILTGYKEVDEEREQIRDIIVYDIPYTWDTNRILGELVLWGKTIKLS